MSKKKNDSQKGKDAPTIDPKQVVSSSENDQAPTISPEEQASTTLNKDMNQPSEGPPAEVAQSKSGFTAGTWNSNKHVTGLYNTHHASNSWVYIAGKGWVKLTESKNVEAMSILTAHAKITNSPVNYYLEGGNITAIYVW